MMAHGNAVRRNFPGMERPCAKCGEQITVTDQMCKYGKYVCGPCQSHASVEYAKRNREKKRASNNAYHARKSGERAASTKAYRQRNPDRKIAHQAVQTALRNGSLVKRPCAVCGCREVHGHHEDYSRPLEVIWLCHPHHMERHAMLAARQKP